MAFPAMAYFVALSEATMWCWQQKNAIRPPVGTGRGLFLQEIIQQEIIQVIPFPFERPIPIPSILPILLTGQCR